jgi:hypothetical protein
LESGFEFGGNFGGDACAASIEPEGEVAVLTEAVKAQLFEEQSALQGNLELLNLQGL